MTNMLHMATKSGEVRFSIAYPFYIDVLSRLGDFNKVEVTESITEYRRSEAGQIL